MGILDITEKKFNLSNDDLYEFLIIQHVRAANSRNIMDAQNNIINRIKASHSLKPDYIKDIITSWFPEKDFNVIVMYHPENQFRVMDIEIQRIRTMTQGSMFGPSGTVFEIRIDKRTGNFGYLFDDKY